MASSSTILEVNQELARKINEEARADPHSPYANKFVGIVDGKVVVIADDLDELGHRLCEIEPDPRKCLGVDASQDPNYVDHIFGS